MKIIDLLERTWQKHSGPFLIHGRKKLFFSDIKKSRLDFDKIAPGKVVAIIGDFNNDTINSLLHLIEKNVIIVPLTSSTRHLHEYFFSASLVDFIIENNVIQERKHSENNNLINDLRKKQHAGIILFTTGTTGRPKAILHDLTLFLKRFETPRASLKTLSFLLFDHIGGLNTLLHTLFNKGIIISPEDRTIKKVLLACEENNVEVLPTTPTFLRMLLLSGLVPKKIPRCIKIITYGTERMDQNTLEQLCKLLPEVDFRQTYGMSELGILRVKSKSRDSLFMKIGGEGISVKVEKNVLFIKSINRMLGYLNAPCPFDKDGWYNTGDIIQENNNFFKIVGRNQDIINVGGLKFLASEIERIAYKFEGVKFVKATGKSNPITGQHAELIVQTEGQIDKKYFLDFLKKFLEPHMVPRRVRFSKIKIGHRFKQE